MGVAVRAWQCVRGGVGAVIPMRGGKMCGCDNVRGDAGVGMMQVWACGCGDAGVDMWVW